MSIKRNVLLAAILAAFSSTFVAQAAEEKPAEATASEKKAEPEKKKAKQVKPHSHAQEKSGTPAAESAEAENPPKKPAHDHGKMHKGQ